MSRAAVAAGCDGLIIEVHHDPDRAVCDGAQSLYPWQYDLLYKQIKQIAPIVGKEIIQNSFITKIFKAGDSFESSP